MNGHQTNAVTFIPSIQPEMVGPEQPKELKADRNVRVTYAQLCVDNSKGVSHTGMPHLQGKAVTHGSGAK